MKGQVPLAFVVAKAGAVGGGGGGPQLTGESLLMEVAARVRSEVGPIATLKHALLVARLPKTRSGKVLRATLRAMADGVLPLRVPATIEDPAVLGEVAEALAGVGYGRGAAHGQGQT